MTRCVAWRGVVWCGVVWRGVVWCGVVWCGVVWCGVVWCGVAVGVFSSPFTMVRWLCVRFPAQQIVVTLKGRPIPSIKLTEPCMELTVFVPPGCVCTPCM